MRRHERYYITWPDNEHIRIFVADFESNDDHTEAAYVRGSLRVWKTMPRNPGNSGHDWSIEDLFDKTGEL